MKRKKNNRREFLKYTGQIAVIPYLGLVVSSASPSRSLSSSKIDGKPIKIRSVNLNFEREPLLRPYGFKGGSVSESFHSIVLLESESGIKKVGVAKQSVLWSDEHVAAAHTSAGGNALMLAVTDYALKRVEGQTFTGPMALQDHIFPDVYRYASEITGNSELRVNFVLNALVGLDHAAWLLYAAENGLSSYDEMIPAEYRPVLSHRSDFVASVPSLSYHTPAEDFQKLADEGFFIMKIKLGQPGSQSEMLEKDKARLSAIHEKIKDVRTKHTPDGKLPYYLDANGRYEELKTVRGLLDHARKIGAYEQILVFEDPFAVENKTPVHDLDVLVASDEGAYSEETAQERIDLGYRAFALKPIAKTLTRMLRVARIARQNDIPCYCADLTAYPLLLEWNRSFVSRLEPFPGLGFSFIETNGHQNYRDWEEQISNHPFPNAPWMRPVEGVYRFSSDYYERSGGLFETPEHYLSLVDTGEGVDS